jgi:hypothetical protein
MTIDQRFNIKDFFHDEKFNSLPGGMGKAERHVACIPAQQDELVW